MSTRSLTPEPARSQPVRTPTESPLARGGVTEMEWDAEASAQAPSPDLHLAELEVHGKRTLVFDDDSARALVTHWLLRELAPMLGLDPSTIEVHVNSEAASRNDARHTTGLIENGAIYIHPRGFDPASKAGRSLLAHETAHAAQRRLSAPGVQHTERAHTAAEQEAAAIAHAFSERATVIQPRSSLPALVTAAAEDATTTAAATNAPAPTELAVSVPISRVREIVEIGNLLSGLWISDGDVFGVMRILDTMAFQVAKTVVSLLGDNAYHLADNINAPHLGPHTASVVATYAALSQSDLQKAIDLDVFGEGSWGAMTSEVKEAARGVIAQLRPNQQQELLKSKNRLNIKLLKSGADILPDSPDERKRADDEVRQKEADRAAARDAIAKLDDNDDAKALLQKVHDALRISEGDEGEPSTPQRSLNAVQLLVPFNGTPMLSFVAEKLDADGLVDTIVQTLPDEYFAEGRPEAETVLELVQARLPSKNIDMVVDLLSYGLFDWAIRDYEAVFAYRILLSLPLSAQYSFRQREGGKYFFRLTKNLPKGKGYREIEVHKASQEELKKLSGQLKDGQKGIVDEEAGLYDAARLYADKRAEAHTAATIKTLMDQAEAAHKKGWKRKDAEDLFYALAAVGGAGFTGKGTAMKFNARDQLLTETAVHDLDSAGYIEELFQALGNDFLFSEDSRIATVKIMMARDPVRAAAHARDLVSYGLLDWMVTDREAYLAYLIVKALPEDERANLIQNDAWAWKRIQSEMSEEMRQSRDLNIYVGDKEGTDRASVLGKLAEESTWIEKNAAVLDGLLRMAIAMSEHKFAFERSKAFKAYAADKPKLNALVKKYKLAESAEQKWTPEILKGTKWYEEGLFQTIRNVGNLLALLGNDLLLQRTVGANNLDLNQVQDYMGGDLLGARLADPRRPKDPSQKANPNANRVTVRSDLHDHALSVELPDLILDSVNFQSFGKTFEAGSVRLRDLKIYVSYDSTDMDEPTSVQLQAGNFEISDLLVAWREKMATVSRFALTSLHLGGGTKDATVRSANQPRVGVQYHRIPFLEPVGQAIYDIFKYLGLFGVTSATEEVGQKIRPGLEQVRALDLTFAQLEVEGVVTSGGQNVGNLKVVDFALRIGLNKTTALRAEIASLDNRKRRKQAQKDERGVKEIELRQQQLAIDLGKLKADEDWIVAAQKRILHETLQPDESKKLQDKINELQFEAKSRQFLDIGGIEATGIGGAVTIESPIKLEGLHGEGTGNDTAAGLGIGIITDAKLIGQMAQGTRQDTKGAPMPFSERGGTFRLDIDQFSAKGVSVGGGQIRGVDEIRAKMKEIFQDKDKPEFAGMYEELASLLPEAQLYEEYLQIGVSALDDEQLKDFQRLRALLARDPSITFGAIDLVRAHLDVNLNTGGIGLGADQATLTKVVVPEKGLSLDEVKGTDIKANAAIGGGLAGWLDWKKNLTGGGVHAGLLELSGARSRGKGLLFDKATLKNGDANIWGRGNVATASFDSLSVEGLGLEPRLELMRRRLAALEQNRRPAPQERKERDRLRKDVPALQGLLDEHILAVAAVDKAKSDAERKKPAELLAHLDALIEAMLARYGTARLQLDDFGIKATSAGDVLSDVLGDGFDKDKVLKRGVTLEGTGKDHQLLGHGSFGYGSPGPDDARVDKTNIETGPVKLNATVKEDDKNNVTVDIAQLDLDSIALSKMMLSGLDQAEGGAKIWSSGRSAFNGIKFAGKLVFAPVVNTEGDYRLTHIGITRFDIESIEARGFGYANSALKVDVRANTAIVHGVHAGGMSIDIPADKDADAVILGKARVESISNADLAATLPGGMELSHGLLNARDLSIGFLEGGGKTLSTADLSLTAAELRGPDGWARFSLEHLSGAITMDKSGYKLEKVKLQKLTVPSLDWRAGETGRITADQPVELAGLSVDGHIDMKEVDASSKRGETAKGGTKLKKNSKLVGVHIASFGIHSITAKHLTYKDGDTTIDIGPPTVADKDIPKFMQKFRPFYIENFTIDGLDWTSETGIEKGEINVEKYGAAVVYQDLGKHLKAGGALTGSKMHASFTGPHTGTATLGKIDKAAGFLKNQDISTKFATMNIMESFTFGDNFVEMNNLVVSNALLVNTVYGAGTPQTVTLGSAQIDKLSMSKIRVDYVKTKKDGKDEVKVTAIKVPEIKFTDISARNFDFKGSSKETEEGKDVTKTKNIHASFAQIDQFRLIDIDYKPEQALTTLGIRLEEDPEKKKYPGAKPSALYISGLAGEFVNKFSDGSTVAKFAARLDAGTMSADNIQLRTVKAEDGRGKTRTTIAGTFALSRLGLEGITGSYTDKKGRTTSLESGYDGNLASVEFEGISPTISAYGTLYIPDISAQAKDFTIRRGSMTVHVPVLDIKKAALGVKGLGTEEGIHDFGLKVGELSVKGLSIRLLSHKERRKKKDVDDAIADPQPRFFAEPLAGLDGQVTAKYSVVPEEHVAITNGNIYFINAHPANIGINRNGLYLEGRNPFADDATDSRFGPRIHIPGTSAIGKLPGISEDFMQSGALDIKDAAEGLVNAPTEPWKEGEADPEAKTWMNHLTVVTGPDGLSLGKGRIGVSLSGDATPGPNDFYLELENAAPGQNVIHIPPSLIPYNTMGERFGVELPQLHAKRTVFPGGTTGAVDLQLIIDMRGLGTLDTDIEIIAPNGKIADIQIGSMKVLDEQGGPTAQPTPKGAGTP